MERNRHFWKTIHPVVRNVGHIALWRYFFCFSATFFSIFQTTGNLTGICLGLMKWTIYKMFWNSVLIFIYTLFLLNAIKFQIILWDLLVVALRLCHRTLFLKCLHFAVWHIVLQHESFITVIKKVQWRMPLANHNSGIQLPMGTWG